MNMHNSRLFALVGAGIGVMGLFLNALTTAGDGLLPTLSQMSSDFPNGIPTIWGGLATWAQVLLVLVIATVATLALRPRHDEPLDRTAAGVMAVLGLALMGYAVSRWLEAGDQAETLEAGFLQAAQNGIISQAYSVDPSTGFVILLVGTVLVVFGGVLGLRQDHDSFF
jgi:hypothetical protein